MDGVLRWAVEKVSRGLGDRWWEWRVGRGLMFAI